MKKRASFSKAVFIGTIIFLSLPLLVLILYSFNEALARLWQQRDSSALFCSGRNDHRYTWCRSGQLV